MRCLHQGVACIAAAVAFPGRMLTSSFIFVKGLNEDQERSLWSHGIIDWATAEAHPDEVAGVLGQSRAGKVREALIEIRAAVAARDAAWFKANWPERETWRLWGGYAQPGQIALVDIETTGLTPGYDQITVIGLADATGTSQVFVAGRPQPGDEALDRFREAIKTYTLIVTFNGANFDLPFIERQFKDQAFRCELPHLDLCLLARTMGMSGGLKDMEKSVGIQRAADIKEMRGAEAIQLWGQWRSQGELAAYRKVTTYCKADCVNLAEFASILYKKRWTSVFTAHARAVDFVRTKGEQLTIF